MHDLGEAASYLGGLDRGGKRLAAQPADGASSEGCPASSCRSEGACVAAASYSSSLLAEAEVLGPEQLVQREPEAAASAPSSVDDGSLIAIHVAEYMQLVADTLPQLGHSVGQCVRATSACCGVGPRRSFVRFLQSFNAQRGECAACFDAYYLPASLAR